MRKRRPSLKKRQSLKRQCSKSVLGEDELLLIMTYFIDSVVHSQKYLDNSRRDMYRTLFALSSSRDVFLNEAKHLFAKYLFETQYHMFGSFHICDNPNIDCWYKFERQCNFRICLSMKWNVISICAFVVCDDSNGKYKIHF